MNQTNHQRYASLWVGISIVLVLGLAVSLGSFDRFDRWLYDEMTGYSRFIDPTPPQVLLVEVETGFQGLGVKEWFSLLKEINRFKPAAIGINILPWNWSEKNIAQAVKKFSLTLGSIRPEDYDLKSNVSYSAVPPIDGISYRQQAHVKHIDAKNYVVFESALASYVNYQDKKYFINFIGGPGRIPVISYQRILSGGLIDELVKDKVVLIGYEQPLMMKILSPLGMMNFSTYQAYALDTLLNDNAIDMIHPALLLAVILLLVVLMLLTALKIPDHYRLISVLGFLLLTLLVSYSSYVFTRFWLMPGYLLIAEISVLLAVLFLRGRYNRQTLQSMAFNSAAKIENRWLSENFYSSDAHWNHITNMVTQTLSLERTIFLEKVENDHRVREIKALNCSLDDISEMRRDYQRTPYTTAIEFGGALKLERKYLNTDADDETQYLVPLNFAGNIQGFWALSIKQTKDFDETRLIDAVEQFALQISELLYHRAEWKKNQLEQRNFIIQLLEMKFEEGAYDSIEHSISFLIHRLSVMESLMDGLASSAILYDLFGRVVHVNKSMADMLNEIDLMPYSMTVVDMIVSLSGCSMLEARNYLSHLILEQGSINIPVKHDGVKTGYMMMISALKADADHNDDEGEIRPFELIGILCELVDMTRIREIYAQKEKVVEHMSGWLRNDLSSISMACDLVQDERITTEKRTGLLQLIKQKVMDLGSNFEQVNNIVQQDLISRLSNKYPVDYIDALKMAVREVKRQQKKSVEIDMHVPFCSPLVMASPKELRQTFSALLKVLSADALEDSHIDLRMSCDKNEIAFEFNNQGFGIPDEQLQAYLQSHENLESDDYQNLRQVANQIIAWGGEFEASSVIGEGMCFRFTLKAFQLNDE